MLKKFVLILVTVFLSTILAAGIVFAEELVIPGSELGTGPEADEEKPTKSNTYGFGWQYTKSAKGLSVKIPVYEGYYIQPIVSFSIDKVDNQTEGHYAIGLRGLYLLPKRQYLQPYSGVGWGRYKDYESSESEYGYEAFLGVEYKEYFLVPALEVGLGGYSKADGSYHAGTTVNFSVFYYF